MIPKLWTLANTTLDKIATFLVWHARCNTSGVKH